MTKWKLAAVSAAILALAGSACAQDTKPHDHTPSATTAEQPTDPRVAIPLVLKAMFEKQNSLLTVEPVSVAGDWAVAGWAQNGQGGRALMKKGEKGWAVHLCSGAGMRTSEGLKASGIPAQDAEKLVADINAAEAPLGAARIALYDSFEGTVMMDGGDHHDGHTTK
jgi:periplasmic copper chaperone A